MDGDFKRAATGVWPPLRPPDGTLRRRIRPPTESRTGDARAAVS
jgi:hypothetical protein